VEQVIYEKYDQITDCVSVCVAVSCVWLSHCVAMSSVRILHWVALSRVLCAAKGCRPMWDCKKPSICSFVHIPGMLLNIQSFKFIIVLRFKLNTDPFCFYLMVVFV